jgi:hypothetical protein
MLEKANRWVGRATNLRGSAERFKIHLLIGAPQDERLMSSFTKATNILNKMPVECELVSESQAEEFASEVQRQVGMHFRMVGRVFLRLTVQPRAQAAFDMTLSRSSPLTSPVPFRCLA